MARNASVRADRRLAGTIEHSEKGALRRKGYRRSLIKDRSQESLHLTISTASGDRYRTLARCWDKFACVKDRGCRRFEAQAL